MNKATHKSKTRTTRKAATTQIEKAKHAIDAVRIDELLPEGSWQRVALGVTAAAGGGLLAAALIGVGPVAIAGTAGYLAYRGMTGRQAVANGKAQS